MRLKPFRQPLPRPDLRGPKESVDEYLARGGRITKVPPGGKEKKSVENDAEIEKILILLENRPSVMGQDGRS